MGFIGPMGCMGLIKTLSVSSGLTASLVPLEACGHQTKVLHQDFHRPRYTARAAPPFLLRMVRPRHCCRLHCPKRSACQLAYKARMTAHDRPPKAPALPECDR